LEVPRGRRSRYRNRERRRKRKAAKDLVKISR